MDWELIPILIFIIVLVSIVMSTLGEVAKRAIRLKERQLELRAGAQSPPAPAKGPDYARLEERVRVLERIATDRAPDLAQQIEDLRELTEGEGVLQ